MARWCSKKSFAAPAARGRRLGARRARGTALRAARCGGARADPLIDAAGQLNILRSRAPQHGEELFLLDERILRHSPSRGDRGGAAPAPCRLPALRYRLARPSRLSRRAVARCHRARRPSSASTIRARLPGDRRRLSSYGCRRRCEPASRARSPRRACSTARIFSARRCASPWSSRRRCPAFCRARRSARGKLVLTLPPDLAALENERLQNRLRQLARLFGGDPEIRLAT